MQQALQTYHLNTLPDGRVQGKCWTNDDEDAGYPTTEADWPVRYRDKADALRQTGGSHEGVSGVIVKVYLDGVEVDRQGRRVH